MTPWVTESALTLKRGFTPGQCKGRRQRKQWRKGIEWALIDGTIMYNLDAIDARAESIAQSQLTESDDQMPRRVVRLK